MEFVGIDLYEKKKQHALSSTQNYNKILNRIHNRIKTTSRTQLSEQGIEMTPTQVDQYISINSSLYLY